MKLSNAKVLLIMLFIQLSTVNGQEGEELLRKRRGLYSPGRPGQYLSHQDHLVPMLNVYATAQIILKTLFVFNKVTNCAVKCQAIVVLSQ